MNKTTFEKKIGSVLRDNMFDRFVSNKKTGTLDNRKLYKIDTTSKIFKKREERKGKKYNITLMVDGSGSMSGYRDALTISAVEKLTTSFKKLKLDYQIQCFNADLIPIKTFKEKTDINKISERLEFVYNKNVDTKVVEHSGKKYMYLQEENKDEYNSCDDSIGAETYNRRRGNFDGYWIHTVINRVKKLKGQNIVIVLSDGRPCHDYGDFYIPHTNKKYFKDYDLSHIVKRAIKDGITFIGIGINTDCVFDYYPEKNTVEIQNEDEMYQAVVDKLNKLVKRG